MMLNLAKKQQQKNKEYTYGRNKKITTAAWKRKKDKKLKLTVRSNKKHTKADISREQLKNNFENS